MAFYEGLGSYWFKFIHTNNLIYNTCWEDPRLDRVALEIKQGDELLVISSAGCNVLDYLIEEPARINAIDMNPRQNALLELKLAAIRGLDYEQFFEMFGRGVLLDYKSVYPTAIRPHLTGFAQEYWDRNIGYFAGSGWRPSFYYYGTAGILARGVNAYIDKVAKVREPLRRFLNAYSLKEQQEIYYNDLRDAFWKKFIRWAVGRDEALSLLGVPKPQRQQVDSTYTGGIAKFIEDRIEYVFATLPFFDNYFWRVYLTGRYTKRCCPEYLKEDNFEMLKDGLVDRVNVHTGSIVDFLEGAEPGRINKFVLLDHMDWLSYLCQPILKREWELILEKAAPDSRLIWRSGALNVDYIDPLRVKYGNEELQLGEVLRYHPQLAKQLHKKDRVSTYGSFYIADMAL